MEKKQAKGNRSENKQGFLKEELIGLALIAVAVFVACALFGLPVGSVGASIAKVLNYALGKAGLLFPVLLFAAGVCYAIKHEPVRLSMQIFAFCIILVCLVGIMHYILIPDGQELTPDLLPSGGGLVGGGVLFVLKKFLGKAGSLIVLIAGLIGGAVLAGKISLSGSAHKAGEGVGKVANSAKDKYADIKEKYQERKAEQERLRLASQTNKEDKHHGLVINDSDDNLPSVKVPSLKEEYEKISKRNKKNAPESDSVYAIKNEDENEPEEVEEPATELVSPPPKRTVRRRKNFKEDLKPSEEEFSGKNGEENEGEGIEENEEIPTYELPPIDLLEIPTKTRQKGLNEEIKQQSQTIESTLNDFRVGAEVVSVTKGPSVTRYELNLAPGVKVSKLQNLSDDLALKLGATGIRIEPIPGKSVIGIEVPSKTTEAVNLYSVVASENVQNATSKLAVGLGKDISGNIITADLGKMPHLLVAGSTGSGKSVCINTIIAGLLFKCRPDEVKLILVDPKVVELTNYNGIPHLLTPVVTSPKAAASSLHWAVGEMERRYGLFAEAQVREIGRYNEQAEEKLPYIVIIIDELADLMMVAAVDVEDAILRLAQKARAAGIHLILATQRPSVDVITGIVKANIPSRIAFAVSSQIDSRTILDMSGAEKLLGKGDMLFYPIGANKPTRVQGAFVSDEELERIVDFIKEQEIDNDYNPNITTHELKGDSKKKQEGTDNPEPAEDELFEDALRLCMDTHQASASMLQRKFRIGYTRAARLVDTMEEKGIVGPAEGSKPRPLIMSQLEIEERFLSNN